MTTEDWNLSAYDFDLPQQLIAQNPVAQRDHSRMMCLSRYNDRIEHAHFYDIVDRLPQEAVLVINNTKVVPARLLGTRPTGGTIEALLVRQEELGCWEALVRRAKRIKLGERLVFGEGDIEATAVERLSNGHWMLKFREPERLLERLDKSALVPLPPYIDRSNAPESQHQNDRERYQTCFAQNSGAIAAPTAGLHFTPAVLDQLHAKGLLLIEVTLHVGLGTFTPIRHDDVRRHAMHSEYFEVAPDSVERLHRALQDKKPVVAVGTTSVRVLETLAQSSISKPSSDPVSGWTDIYIYPPYQFKWVSGLLTNFHLPSSTLLLLVSALYGREKLMRAYREAILQEYRFFSYGDCMLIL